MTKPLTRVDTSCMITSTHVRGHKPMMTEKQVRAYRDAVEQEKHRKLHQPGPDRVHGDERIAESIRINGVLEALDNVLYGLNHR